MGARKDFALDLARYARYGRGRGPAGRLALVLTTEELWVLGTYRLARWALHECRIPVLKTLVSVAARVHLRFLRVLLGVWISPHAKIGGGLLINHFGAIWISPDAVMGRFCNLHHGVTIGVAGRGRTRGVPQLGDRVNLSPYAVLLGKIRVGSNVLIGANSLVIQDIPDNAVAIGVPARVLSLQGSGIPEDPTVPEQEPDARPPEAPLQEAATDTKTGL
jgi:serine O-acetyltransferase